MSFLAAVALHSVGHALVALVAGALAAALGASLGIRSAAGSHLWPGAPLDRAALWLSVVGLVLLAVKAAAGAYATFVQARIAGEVGSALRLRLLDALFSVHRLRHPRHGDHGSSRSLHSAPAVQAVAALTERVREVETGLEQGLIGGARAAAQLIPLAALLVALSPRMAAAALGVLSVFGGLLRWVRSSHRGATRRAAHARERLLDAADQAVRHADLWVTYGAESKARAHVQALGRTIAWGAARLRAREVGLSGANEVLAGVAVAGAAWASQVGWLGAATEGGRLLGFVIAFFLAYRPLRELAEARLASNAAQTAYDDLRSTMLATPDGALRPAPAAGARDWALERLELCDLRLACGRLPALSFAVEPGSVIALIGPTGVGKTTLLRTLLGLTRPSGGDVRYGGQSLAAAAGPSTRPFAWVPQDAPVLADTLAGNVALGNAGADVAAALDALGAERLASSLGAERLGGGGRELSGGERQWIALARAFATKLPVLLLDEPTSGLDPQAQEQVLAAIARLRNERTVIIVTHRSEPLVIADRVIRLEPNSGVAS